MKIVVVGGLGVVGSAVASYFMSFGHDVIINDVIAKCGVYTDLNDCLGDEDFIFVCVPTPSKIDGSIDLSVVESVTKKIAGICHNKGYSPNVVFKSTVIPGTTRRMADILHSMCEFSNVAFNPEFLRERYAIEDMMKPSRIVVGSDDMEFCKRVMSLYSVTNAPKFEFFSFEEAELLKYYANCYYATRISFFNQMKLVSDRFFVDHDRIVKAIVADSKVGVHGSDPTGQSFGGNCLKKDCSAFINFARKIGVCSDFLCSVMKINKIFSDVEKFQKLGRWTQ